jgi:phosphohistidine phosphatase
MELYILRHAIAVERGTAGFEDDSLRPLTDKGAKKMVRIAQGMLALEFSLDAIYSSPYVRARQTAEIVADVFDARDRLVLTPHLAVGGKPGDLLKLVNGAGGASVMLVGHEPYLSTLISMLIAGTENVPITLKKGGLCKLTASKPHYGRCATLEWLLTPRTLAGP